MEQARGRVEAVELGCLDEALRAELGAERREDAVARLREGLGEAPTTGFVVGVGDLTAADHDRGLGRELVRELDHPRLEGGGGRDHLERRARRLRPGEGDPRQGQDRAVASVQHGDAAKAAAERRHRGLLEAGIDGRVNRLAGDRLAFGEHRPTGWIAVVGDRDELTARPSGEPPVEGELEPARPGRRARRESEPRQLAVLLGGGRCDLPGDALGGGAERGGAARGRPLGQRGPVARQDRGPLGHLRAPHQVLSGPQPGEDQVWGPGDLLARQRQHQPAVDLPEGVGLETDRHDRRRPALGLGGGGLAGRQARHRCHLLRPAVLVRELGQRVALRRPGGDLRVHGGEVLALPFLGKALRRPQIRAAIAPDRPDEEGCDREQGDR